MRRKKRTLREVIQILSKKNYKESSFEEFKMTCEDLAGRFLWLSELEAVRKELERRSEK